MQVPHPSRSTKLRSSDPCRYSNAPAAPTKAGSRVQSYVSTLTNSGQACSIFAECSQWLRIATLIAKARAGSEVVAEDFLHMPLSTAEVKALAGLARAVDQCSSTRDRLSAALSLRHVIEIVDDLGCCDLTAALLIRARHHLSCTGWIWQRSTGPFRDHLYILSLTTLVDSQIQRAQPSDHRHSQEPSRPAAATPASTAPTLDQALETVRAHGYLPVKLDSLPADTSAGPAQAR